MSSKPRLAMGRRTSNLSAAVIFGTLMLLAGIVAYPVRPVQALGTADTLGCTPQDFYGQSGSLGSLNNPATIIDCAIEAANIMQGVFGINVLSNQVVEQMIAIAWAESSFQPGCVGPGQGGACAYSFPSTQPVQCVPNGPWVAGDASGILQEGQCNKPDAPWQIGVFTNANAQYICPGYGTKWTNTNWEGVYFNPLCAFEWAYAYYWVNGYGDWQGWGSAAFYQELNILDTAQWCYEFCADSSIHASVLNSYYNHGFVVRGPNDGKYFGCGGTQLDYCMFKIVDYSNGLVDDSGCVSSPSFVFKNDYDSSMLGDIVYGYVWYFTDPSCTYLVTAAAGQTTAWQHSSSYGGPDTYCYYYTSGQCGGFDNCNLPNWDMWSYTTGPPANCIGRW